MGGRLHIRHALSSRIVCLPGAATADNGWSIPRHIFGVRDVVGQYLYMVDDVTGQRETEQIRATAVRTREGKVAPPWFMLSDVAIDNVVTILTGEEVLPFDVPEVDDVPCGEFSTPPTPPTPPAVM